MLRLFAILCVFVAKTIDALVAVSEFEKPDRTIEFIQKYYEETPLSVFNFRQDVTFLNGILMELEMHQKYVYDPYTMQFWNKTINSIIILNAWKDLEILGEFYENQKILLINADLTDFPGLKDWKYAVITNGVSFYKQNEQLLTIIAPEQNPFSIKNDLRGAPLHFGFFNYHLLLDNRPNKHKGAFNYVAEEIARAMNASLHYKCFQEYGYENQFYYTNDLMRLHLRRKWVDVVGLVFNFEDPYRDFLVTTQLAHIRFMWILPPRRRYDLTETLVKVFKPELWALTLLAFFTLIFLINQLITDRMRSVLIALQIVLISPLSPHVSKHGHLLLVITLIALAYLPVTSVYTAMLNSAAMHPLLEPKIRNVIELARSDVDLGFLRTSEPYLRKQLPAPTVNRMMRKLKGSYINFVEILEDCVKNKRAGMISELEFWLLKNKEIIPVLDVDVYVGTPAFGFKKGSGLFAQANDVATRCVEAGLIHKWISNLQMKVRKWFVDGAYSYQEQWNVQDFMPIFLMYLAGMGIASIAFIVELSVNHLRKRQNTSPRN